MTSPPSQRSKSKMMKKDWSLLDWSLEGVLDSPHPPGHLLSHLPPATLVQLLHHGSERDPLFDDISGEDLNLQLLQSYLPPLFPALLTPRLMRPQLLQLFKTATEREFEAEMTRSVWSTSTTKQPPEEDCPNGITTPPPRPPYPSHLRHLPLVIALDFIRSPTQSHHSTFTTSLRDGLALGSFLIDSGWFYEAQLVLSHTHAIAQLQYPPADIGQHVRLLEKLVIAESYYKVSNSSSSSEALMDLLQKLKSPSSTLTEDESDMNLASSFNALSIHHYSENRYDDALRWSIAALGELGRKVTVKDQDNVTAGHSTCPCCPSYWAVTVIDVLRQAATCCSVKRELTKAHLLITRALSLAKAVFGGRSVKWGDVLMDYGFYLISSDNVRASVEIYKEALQIRRSAFGSWNILTALALTELSYSIYVLEYNTGTFGAARRYAEEGIAVARRLLPSSHLLQASSSRVLALILEEIAIDSTGSPAEKKLLSQAESLHKSCLSLTLALFGENNVQSAKHYGNLGRLYQTMKKYEDAEVMHLKAISIKERLLGEWDYEVALSVGHLASLYNYDLLLWSRAEQLHLRSIAIGRRLFGEAYSGLEYDYRGLLQVYLMTEREDKYGEYSGILSHWKELQDLKSGEVEAGGSGQHETGGGVRSLFEPLGTTLTKFNELKWARWTQEEAEEALGQGLIGTTPTLCQERTGTCSCE